MTCALCLENQPLKRSHIVPEFMFRPLYDKKHRFFEISNLPSKPNKLFQKGLRERLLCERCEEQLATYEDYASRVFFGDGASRPYRSETGLLFSGLEYKRLKLFFMSLLWRFSVTGLKPYRGAELGRHGEVLRALIYADDPADYLTFPCMITALMLDNKHVSDVIVPPLYTRQRGRRVWAFVVAGFLFHFFVSNRPAPAGFLASFLQENGRLLLNLGDIRKITFLDHWFREMAAAESSRTKRNG